MNVQSSPFSSTFSHVRLLFAELMIVLIFCFFFFNDTATTEIYTLSLHDALPIYRACATFDECRCRGIGQARQRGDVERSEEHTSELQSPDHLVCRLLLEKKKHQVIEPLQLLGRRRAAKRLSVNPTYCLIIPVFLC